MYLRIDRLVGYLAVCTLFVPAFRIRTGTIDLYLYYALLPVILLLCVASGSRLLNRGLALLLLGFTMHSVASVALFGNELARAAQQIVGISVMLVVFYNVASVNRFDAPSLFSAYMSFAKLATSIAVLQWIAWAAGIRYGYDLSWLVMDYYQSYSTLGLPRIQSVFSEPSHFALAMSPAIYAAVVSLTGRSSYFASRSWSVLILAVAALSFSSMAYVAAVLALCLAGLRQGGPRLPVVGSAAGLVAIGAYLTVPDFRVRVDDTLLTFLYADMLQKNISTLTLYNNWQVALDNLYHSYLFGGGLGSHPIAFERFATLFSVESLPLWLASLNAQDANSLFLRILSELGLPGLLCLTVFLVSYRMSVAPPHESAPSRFEAELTSAASVVSGASLTFVAVALARHGHYFATGTPFFLVLYFSAYLYVRRHRDEHETQPEGYASTADAGEPA